MRYSVHTDPGRRYELNEDVAVFDEASNIWLVADGMGGHPAGEVASEIAATKVLELARQDDNLTSAYQAAHQEIIDDAARTEGCEGMGTTIVGMLIRGNEALFAWVGDSRGYLWRNGQLRPVTRDHSFMQLLLDQKRITPAEARNHPQRNVVTQVLGVGEPEPDTTRIALRQGDWLLLCTDGLNDELTDEEIGAILGSDLAFDALAGALVESACNAGGRDNVTALIVAPEIDGSASASETTLERPEQSSVAAEPEPRAPRSSSAMWATVGIALVAAVLVSVWYLWGG